MARRDYILQMFEEIGRALAQIIYQREIKDYKAAHALIDEQLKQTLGVGRGFLLALTDDTLLAMLTTLGTLNADKCWAVATLLKVDGDLYEDQAQETEGYYSYLKACNLFLEALHYGNQSHEMESVSEIEEVLAKLEDYELPLRTQQLLFWYYDITGRYGKAEDMLFEIVEAGNGEDENEITNEDELDEVWAEAEAFYARLSQKSDKRLEAGNFSRAEIAESLARLHQFNR
jgi:hypothetical protein